MSGSPASDLIRNPPFPHVLHICFVQSQKRMSFGEANDNAREAYDTANIFEQRAANASARDVNNARRQCAFELVRQRRILTFAEPPRENTNAPKHLLNYGNSLEIHKQRNACYKRERDDVCAKYFVSILEFDYKKKSLDSTANFKLNKNSIEK